jgi:hemolysin activation/secretion protein
MIGGGFILPLGADGWTVNPEYTNSYTRLVPAPDTPATIGDFERFALRVNFPLIRDRSQTLSFGGALERIDQSLYAPALQTDINHDSYGVARLSADWRSLSPWGAPFQANLQISQGLGGRNAADAAASQIPLSRQGATPDFSKFSTDLQLTQLVDGDLSLDVYGRAQASFGKPLFLSEQFALDGAEGLSAASDGAFNVDTGATLREELTMRCPYRADVAAVTASPYLFAAQGWGLLYQPTSVEQGETTAVALGLGAHLAWETPDGRTGGLFGLEIGRLYSNEQNLRASTRVNLSTSLHF